MLSNPNPYIKNNKMNQTLTSIIETLGSQSLNISNQSFLEDNLFEETIDSCFLLIQ